MERSKLIMKRNKSILCSVGKQNIFQVDFFKAILSKFIYVSYAYMLLNNLQF